ncbi:hypothetical protein AAF712_016894, partial [Marasmius tenuissimus]
MRMFCWAATGAPYVLTDGIRTKVILVEDVDEEYGAGLIPSERLTNLNAGVYYVTAASTLLGDEGATTPGSSQSSTEALVLTVKEAVEHWLL